ncbi:response regulator transcription factor [Nocardia seriolae]|uniref:HTH-type transcriptional regulator MalT n=1 Tax=Nocardia seriolae TaxID=37332 RepID=A0ABC9YS36_9NOCA|nr:response regulator transcription factor [Nocardia seriolae]APA98218.1 HTH-type transcriptional regulator MalT [Nocardia seriolae]OJF80152.1 hypothetical protein NS14008_14275 [Nocardia seriolae]WKY49838.1 response regulator transcription factor [Nocardia seriolae]WNJ56324.1 response regulator transcription factor [Nocardia seriolae]BAW06388.1 conserved hypothetical protein [Nocardia seriolae]
MRVGGRDGQLETLISNPLAPHRMPLDVPPEPPVDLTDRERDVLRLMAQGRNNSEIAGELFIGVSTVKTHINSLFAKLGVRDRGQAIAYAHRTGLAR